MEESDWNRGEPPSVPELLTEPPPGARVLVVGAHADDETFGCGGLIALHARNEAEIALGIFTQGDRGDPEGLYQDRDYVELRREEARDAGEVLGIRHFHFYDYPDQMGMIGRHLYPRLVADLEKLIREFEPDLVYHPWVGEAHPDHWFLALATEEVAARTPDSVLFLGYEIWSVFVPDLVVDVGPVYEAKEAAMTKYVSQLRYYDYIPICHALDTYRTLYFPSARYCEAYVRRRGGTAPTGTQPPQAIDAPSPRRTGWLRRLLRSGGAD